MGTEADPPVAEPAAAPAEPEFSDAELLDDVHELTPAAAEAELGRLRAGSPLWDSSDPGHAFARDYASRLEHVILRDVIGQTGVDELAGLLRQGAPGREQAKRLLKDLEGGGPAEQPTRPMWNRNDPRHREAIARRNALYKVAFPDEADEGGNT